MIKIKNYEIIPDIFPDKTSQVWRIPNQCFDEKHVEIYWDFLYEAELIHIAQLNTLLQKNNIKTSLYINYLPYGRQDKDISNTSTFALFTFSKIINSLNFESVTILDPHSNKALDLITRSIAIYPEETLLKIYGITKSDLLCYPDKGAISKYSKIYDLPYIYGEKNRDQLSGNILKYELIGEAKDKTILINDDLVDGGATFIILAKSLYDNGANSVSLFVTHGIFSKGLKPLYEAGIDRIFTAKGEAVDIGDNIVGYKKIT